MKGGFHMASSLILKIKSKLVTYGELVMFSHTLFSLPFALMAMLLAAEGFPEPRVVFWIFVALFAGRNGANALNRYVDASYDAKNPRTQTRHIPSGKMKGREALLITLFCYIVFVVAAANLNSICLWLSPIALILFTLYSYTKRFTWLCHIVLGITCAGAPVGAWLAVTGSFNIIPLIIAAIVTLWVAGFDIIYGTQDIDFDRAEGLFSIPARFGYDGALWIARAFHFSMWLLMISLYFLTTLDFIYLIGVIISGALLIFEHYMVDPKHRFKMNVASYHINQVISILLLFVTSLDIFIKK
jgi:4-hydroxybenzoate polyprenyltransferase